MEENDTSQTNRPTWLIVAGFAVVALLILAGLFLPPISLGERLGFGGSGESAETTESTETMAEATSDAAVSEAAATIEVRMPEGVALSIPTGGDVAVEQMTVADLAASSDSALSGAVAMPVGTALVGDVYVLNYDGEAPSGQIAVPLPADAGSPETLDLYAWDGVEWSHAAGQIDAATQKAVLDEGPLPVALIVAQTAAPDTPAISLMLGPDVAVPETLQDGLTEVSSAELLLDETANYRVKLPWHRLAQPGCWKLQTGRPLLTRPRFRLCWAMQRFRTHRSPPWWSKPQPMGTAA
ncbi:MAG: hypothetical protein R3C44_01675 [Chloroflexota bacterium]